MSSVIRASSRLSPLSSSSLSLILLQLQLGRPRPSLPWDVLLVLFELADPSSLALLGRVSYDFLVSTVPHLYQDVVLSSPSQISVMFCAREEKKKVSSTSPFSFVLPSSLSPDFLSTSLSSPPLRESTHFSPSTKSSSSPSNHPSTPLLSSSPPFP